MKYVFDDDQRPALPYVAGACFRIKRHEPLTPFDGGRCYENPKVSSLSDPVLPPEILRPYEILKPGHNLTPWVLFPSKDTDPCKIAPGTITERYLRHRPRKTVPHPEHRTTRRLDIVRQIRVRDGAYSQVVQCRVDGIQGPLVAKIFDPLYSSDDVYLDEGQSPVGLTESEWAREAAAYTRIKDKGLDGRYTPRFEGCWSFDIPYELELVSNSAAGHVSTADNTTGCRRSGSSGDERHEESSDELVRRTIKVTRNVRLLLMEYIPGDSILHLLKSSDYKKTPAKVRMDLVAQVAEAESALWHIRVSHGDRHSRNVVVCARTEHHRSSSSASTSSLSSSSNTTSSNSGTGEEWTQVEQNQQQQRDEGVQEWRAVWVDFGNSVVLDLPDAKINISGRLSPPGELPPNPITRCRGSWPLEDLCLADNTNWIDKRYDEFESRRKWMEARWGEGSPSAYRYQPVEYDKLHPRIEE